MGSATTRPRRFPPNGRRRGRMCSCTRSWRRRRSWGEGRPGALPPDPRGIWGKMKTGRMLRREFREGRMTTVIKNGTIVTADLTYRADVLIDGGRIAQIGENLKGDRTLDATGCYVMPGGIDPHTHLEMPFMGTYSTDDFESGTRAALSGGTPVVVDVVLPGQGQGLIDAKKMWHNQSTRANCDYSYHMAVTWWGEQVFNEMKTVIEQEGITTFKHFMAYK